MYQCDEEETTSIIPMTYADIGREIGELVQAKNAAYGDSFSHSGEVLRILYPKGIPPDGYTDALAVIRVIDKLFRLANEKDAFGESPWRDIVGYGILGIQNHELLNKIPTKKVGRKKRKSRD